MSIGSLESSSIARNTLSSFLPPDTLAAKSLQLGETNLTAIKDHIDRLHNLGRNEPAQKELSLMAKLASFIKSYIPVSKFVHEKSLIKAIDPEKAVVPANVDDYLKQYGEFADLPKPKHLLQIVPIVIEGSKIAIFITVDLEASISENMRSAVKAISITPDLEDKNSALVNFKDLSSLPKGLEEKLEAIYEELKDVIFANLQQRGFSFK